MTARNRATGRYTDSRFDRPCVCGHPLGSHTAERGGDEQPCLAPDCACETFTRATPPSITCPQCGWRSYHPTDIAERYCGHCHQFHECLLVPRP